MNATPIIGVDNREGYSRGGETHKTARLPKPPTGQPSGIPTADTVKANPAKNAELPSGKLVVR
ncbi:MAG: hypothetical protein AB8B91_16885 [Rubripirellula sp.]